MAKFFTALLNWQFKYVLCTSLKHFIILFSSSNTQFYESRIFCLLFEYFFQIKVLNQYQNTPKNANITCYIQKKKPLCNTLNWGNWNSGFVKLAVRDIDLSKESVNKFQILFLRIFRIPTGIQWTDWNYFRNYLTFSKSSFFTSISLSWSTAGCSASGSASVACSLSASEEVSWSTPLTSTASAAFKVHIFWEGP